MHSLDASDYVLDKGTVGLTPSSFETFGNLLETHHPRPVHQSAIPLLGAVDPEEPSFPSLDALQ